MGGYVRWGGGWLAMKDLWEFFVSMRWFPHPWRGQVKNRALKKFDWRVPTPYFFGCFVLDGFQFNSIQRRHIFLGLADLGFIIIFFPGIFEYHIFQRVFAGGFMGNTFSNRFSTSICMKHLWHMIHEMRVSGWAMCEFCFPEAFRGQSEFYQIQFFQGQRWWGFFLPKNGI